MYCPNCGQERISDATRFCSRCGYLLTGTAELLKVGGASLKATSTELISPRSRGIKQGLFIFLLMFVVAPILGMISVFGLGIVPWPMGVSVFLLGVGGLLRIAYALMFESNNPVEALMESRGTPELNPAATFSTSALPPQPDMSASEYVSPTAGRRPELTTDRPGSITEGTTRLLEKERETDQ